MAAALLGAGAVTAAWTGAGSVELRLVAAALGGLAMGYAIGIRDAELVAGFVPEAPGAGAEPAAGDDEAVRSLLAALEATRLDPAQRRWVRAIARHSGRNEGGGAPGPFDVMTVMGEALDALAWRAMGSGVEVTAEIDGAVAPVVRGDAEALIGQALRWGGQAVEAGERAEIEISLRPVAGGLAVGVPGIGESIVPAEPEEDGEPARRPLPLDGVRVLVAEDRPKTRAMLAAALRRRQMTVDEAANGEEAVEREHAAALERMPYDVILLDSDLGPGIDGLAAMRRFESWLRGAGAPVVLLVGGRDLAGQLRAAAAAGVRHVLVKPILEPVLESTVLEALGDAALGEELDAVEAPVAAAVGVAAGAEIEEAASPAVGRKRLLVIEDLVSHAEVMRAFLGEQEYDMQVATTGAEALRAFDRQRFDLVTSDLELPDMDGLELARQLRHREAISGLARTPLLCLTAHMIESREKELWTAGFDAFLAKPLQRQRLRAEVERLLADNTAYEVPAVMQQLIPGYLQDNLQAVRDMRAHVAAGEFEPVRRCGHNLKGTGSMFGFPEVTLLGAALQRAAIGGEAAEAAELLDRLEEVLRKSAGD